MRTSNAMKWSMAAATLLGLGLVAIGSANASPDEGTNDDPGNDFDETGTRHGIRYEGCRHFELVGPDALESWAMDNSLRFAKWATKLGELRRNPEPAIIEAMTMLFPECPWPPPDGGAPVVGGPSIGLGPNPQALAGAMFGRVLAFGLRAQPLGGSHG